jgi:hypothetical protein
MANKGVYEVKHYHDLKDIDLSKPIIFVINRLNTTEQTPGALCNLKQNSATATPPETSDAARTMRVSKTGDLRGRYDD